MRSTRLLRARTARDVNVRTGFGLLRDPVFGAFFWGKVLSVSGIWIHNIAAAVLVYQITGRALMVAVVSAVQFAPQLLLAPLSGKLTDRGNAMRQLLLSRLLTCVGSGGLAVWIWAVDGPDGLPGAGPVVGASLVVGIGFVVGGPAMQSVVPTLIRPGEMAPAMALNNAPMIVARAGGPAAAALITAEFGPATAFAIAATTSVVHGLVLMTLRLPGRPAGARGEDFSVRASLRHVRSHPELAALLVGTAAVAIGAEPSVTLAPSLAEAMDGTPGLAGWLASAFGIGAAVGFVVFGPAHRLLGMPRLSGGGLVIMAAGLAAAAAASGHPAMALTAMGTCGLGMTLALTSLATQVQEHTPDELRGRIMALWLVAFLGARPFAAGLNGLVSDLVSVRASLLGSAVLVLAAAWPCRPGVLRGAAPGVASPSVVPTSDP